MNLLSETISALGPGEEPKAYTPLWAMFDPDWYRERYGDSVIEMTGGLPDDRGLFEFWLRDGARYAHSPNRYFDEIWYRRENFDVESGIRMGVFDSGFQHYCETGHRGRSCHWLFSESDYFRLNPDLTPAAVRDMGYSNGYDHYLAVGQVERRASSAFLMPDLVRAGVMQQRLPYDPAVGEFTRLILSEDTRELRTSWYFDPVWYLQTYEDVAPQIASGVYVSALHHYLSNENPTHYNPNPVFDETRYLERYPDVNDQVRARAMRNGYDHFVHHGQFEGRSHADGVELKAVLNPGFVPTWKMICDNAFIDLVKHQASPVEAVVVEPPALRQLSQLQAQRAETLLPLLSRNPLDFRYVGRPELSVVIAQPSDFLALLQTLVSLHEGNRGTIQVVLIDSGAKDETAEIGRYARGVEVVRPDSPTLQQGWQRAVPQLDAPRVLLIEAGCHLYYGALDAGLAQLDRDGVIAVAPQCLGFDLRVIEAGLMVARDGSCVSYAEGMEAFAPEIDFVRPCDTVGGGALLCHLDALRDLPTQLPDLQKLRVPTSIWAALGLSLRQNDSKGRIVYEPRFAVRAPERNKARLSAIVQEALILRRCFAEVLRGNPPQAPQSADTLYRSSRWGKRLLILARAGSVSASAQRARLKALSQSLIDLGCQVTVFVLVDGARAHDRTGLDLPESTEYRSGGLEILSRLIEQRVRGFDHVWIYGGLTLNAVFDLMQEKAGHLPEDAFTLDLREIETVSHRLDEQGAGKSPVFVDEEVMTQHLAEEVGRAWFCRNVVVQNIEQASLLRDAGLTTLTVLGDDVPARQGVEYAQRRDLLFAAQPATTPGYTLHFLKWFVREVLSRLEGRLAETPRLILACETLQSLDLSMITHYRHVAPLTEGQKDFAELASSCRVMISPGESLGHVSLERLEAASCGLPCVIEGEEPGRELLEVPHDARLFAEAIIRLYQDEETWRRHADAASRQAAAMTAAYRETLARLVGLDKVKDDVRD
ncbi:glycosyltransferase [Asaia astilbis]|uniref:glycosyltransferase n=1 Tax=Asaia astilbis TaxID=610244 RepID=UPI0012EC3285|nr:glycosyltransferase family 4 protein [Asaia astilbis]